MTSKDTQLFDSRMLRLFDLLYSTHSVTRAADQLGQSQPTVSIWLGKLREQFHDPLFVRTSDGMQPTPRAEALIPTVRSALESFRLMARAEASFDPATTDRRFRICMTDASHVTLLPRLLAYVRGLAPKVRLEAARIDDAMPLALQSGGADLAIGLIPQLEAGFYQQTLFTQDWVCLTHAHHPRLSQTSGGKMTLREYKQEAHISIAAGTGHSLLTAALKRQAVERRVQLDLPGFLGLPAIVSTTDLVVTLPRQIGETLAAVGGLRVLNCPVRVPSFAVKQHWHARYHHDAASQWLRSVCATLFLASATNRRS